MNTDMNIKTDCKGCQAHLPDLLLDEGYAEANASLAQHLESCAVCSTELHELRATFAMLDEFAAPAPSLYFDTRLHARLREAENARPEGFFARLRSFVLFSTGRSFQPAMAGGALALLLVVGGGGTFVLHGGNNAVPPAAATASSATVNDLKVLDNNDTAEQQMGQLLDESGSEDEDGPPTT